MNHEQAGIFLHRYLRQQRDIGIEEIVLEPSKNNNLKSQLTQLYNATKECSNCGLSKTRTNYVFGEGNPNAELMFVGEAPGGEEDLQGKPFIGAAGQLLTKMIAAMGLRREDVYIGNILKCRPPGNRNPEKHEIEQCIPILKKQIDIIKPEFICALGRIAAHSLLGVSQPLGKLRGRFHDIGGIKLIVTYHPSALLRNPQWKRPAWEDLQMLMREMGATK